MPTAGPISPIFPQLITPDEVAYLEMTVMVNGQIKYRGLPSEIIHKAEDVIAWLGFFAPIKTGSVMGLDTIPATTGLDHEQKCHR